MLLCPLQPNIWAQFTAKTPPNLSPAPPTLQRTSPASLFVARARKGQEKSSVRPTVVGRKKKGLYSASATICDASNETELFMSANRVSSSKVSLRLSLPCLDGRGQEKTKKKGRSVYCKSNGKEISFKERKTSLSQLQYRHCIHYRARLKGFGQVW